MPILLFRHNYLLVHCLDGKQVEQNRLIRAISAISAISVSNKLMRTTTYHIFDANSLRELCLLRDSVSNNSCITARKENNLKQIPREIISYIGLKENCACNIMQHTATDGCPEHQFLTRKGISKVAFKPINIHGTDKKFITPFCLSPVFMSHTPN